jgi:hypothetical protein
MVNLVKVRVLKSIHHINASRSSPCLNHPSREQGCIIPTQTSKPKPFSALLMFCNLFALALLDWRFKVTMLFHILKNTGLRNFSLKATEYRFNAFAFARNDLGHLNISLEGKVFRLLDGLPILKRGRPIMSTPKTLEFNVLSKA